MFFISSFNSLFFQIEFSVDGLENEWNVMGIDEIALINPLTHQPICRR